MKTTKASTSSRTQCNTIPEHARKHNNPKWQEQGSTKTGKHKKNSTNKGKARASTKSCKQVCEHKNKQALRPQFQLHMAPSISPSACPENAEACSPIIAAAVFKGPILPRSSRLVLLAARPVQIKRLMCAGAEHAAARSSTGGG